MKTITIEEARNILQECHVVLMNNRSYYSLVILELSEKNKNTWLYLEGIALVWEFDEGLNQIIELKKNSMILKDISGRNCEITPLYTKELYY